MKFNIVGQFLNKPLGLIGVVLVLFGLYYWLTNNLLYGFFYLLAGSVLAYISEKR